ncbi:Protein of unknown function (DUF1266) [Parelusimicrobium proximum]|uniref:DUF1266 domain-containing protein n=1 Tax=Parelusimicrobium proximum TaxID=3228953 RepID=UPI003D1869D5
MSGYNTAKYLAHDYLEALGVKDEFIYEYARGFEEIVKESARRNINFERSLLGNMKGIRDNMPRIRNFCDTFSSTKVNWALAMGSDFAFHNNMYLNEMDCGLIEEECRYILGKMDIECGEDLHKKIEFLKEKGDRHNFTIFANAVKMLEEAEGGFNPYTNKELNQKVENYLLDNLDYKDSIVTRLFFNVRHAMEKFTEDGLFKGDLPSFIAWDYERLTGIIRLGYSIKYITKEAAEELLKPLHEEIQKSYTSWREMSIAYQFGHAVYEGLGETYAQLKGHMEILLSSDNSPWNCIPFDSVFKK